MNRLIIHIGTQKTGSTYIQNFFLKNYDKFLARNILFPNIAIPNIEKIEGRTSGHSLLIKNISKPNNELIKKLKFKIEELKPRTLILSSENYSLNPQMIPYLKKSFKAKEYKVIIYLRRQDHFIESMYKERILGGWHQETIPIEEFIHFEHGSINTFVPDYDKLIAPWAEEFGKENIIVRPFNVNQWYKDNLARDFLKATKLRWNKDFDINELYSNKSISADLTEYVRYVNKIKLPSNKHRQFVLKNNAVLVNAFKSVKLPRTKYLSKNQRKSILEKYKKTNSIVEEKYLDSHALFDTTIDDVQTIPSEILTNIPLLMELLVSAINLKSEAIYESMGDNLKLIELVRLDAIQNKSTLEHLKWELEGAIKELEQTHNLREELASINTDLSSKLSLQDVMTTSLKGQLSHLKETFNERNDVLNNLSTSTDIFKTQLSNFMNKSEEVSSNVEDLKFFRQQISTTIEDLVHNKSKTTETLNNIRKDLIDRMSDINLNTISIDRNSESITMINTQLASDKEELLNYYSELEEINNKVLPDISQLKEAQRETLDSVQTFKTYTSEINSKLLNNVSSIYSELNSLTTSLESLKVSDTQLESKISESMDLLANKIEQLTGEVDDFRKRTNSSIDEYIRSLQKEIESLHQKNRDISNELVNTSESILYKIEANALHSVNLEGLISKNQSIHNDELIKESKKLSAEIKANALQTVKLEDLIKNQEARSQQELQGQAAAITSQFTSLSKQINVSVELLKSERNEINEKIYSRLDELIVQNIENESSVRIVDFKNDELKYTLETIFKLNFQRSYHSKFKSLKRLFQLNFRSQLSILRKSKLINPVYYYSQIPELKYKAISCEKHYLSEGVLIGVNPNREFNTKKYMHANPDLIYLGINPLVHYYLKKF